MDMSKPLFEAQNIHLSYIDHEKDAAIESLWTHDPGYARMLGPEIARPLSVFEIKQRYEKIEKDAEDDRNLFYFTVRLRSDDRLVGMTCLHRIEWTCGSGFIKLGIGAAEDRRKGWGTEVLQLMLRYAFGELNLHRLSASVAEYNQPALNLFKQQGFKQEVLLRKALHRDGRSWDQVFFGLLQSEWEKPDTAGKEMRS